MSKPPYCGYEMRGLVMSQAAHAQRLHAGKKLAQRPGGHHAPLEAAVADGRVLAEHAAKLTSAKKHGAAAFSPLMHGSSQNAAPRAQPQAMFPWRKNRSLRSRFASRCNAGGTDCIPCRIAFLRDRQQHSTPRGGAQAACPHPRRPSLFFRACEYPADMVSFLPEE